MRVYHRLGTLLAVCLTAVGLVNGGLGAGVANAVPTGEQQPAASGGTFTLTAARPWNIIRCEWQVQYPHKSSHVPGTVNVVTTASCDHAVVYLKIRVDLYYDSDRVDRRSFSGWGTTSVRGNAAAKCVDGLYQGKALIFLEAPPGYTPHLVREDIRGPMVYIHC